MPCFKGLAVSIHTNDGPLPEYSIQKQGRVSRITSYIPVPPPKVPAYPGAKPEQSTFAISITLLTPGINVPYSTPRPTDDDPNPRPQIVGGLPGLSGERGRFSSVIGPYQPISSSPNETIAAYIYFDGRPKEEVATLLRRGEETWVNSRWVGVPESEGGGLAEREFLFREVGLERWLNGLDLSGKDAAAQLEKRKQKIERKRQRRRRTEHSDMSDEDGPSQWRAARDRRASKGVLRYGADAQAPLEKISDEDENFSSDSDSDDDPIPEATGQIKVALFRVLASGEIKKGEYSPQYDAHDDDDDFMKGVNGNSANNGGEADIDHTTSFAKPKTLDPKSISTQTVTGIDGPDKPYAVFTFLYRGQKQLQKMGILKSKTADKVNVPTKRRSIQTDFANLKPLSKTGTVGFTSFRDLADKASTPRKSRAFSGSKGSPPSSTKRARDNRHFDSEGSDASDEDDGAMTPTKKEVLEVEAEDFKTILSSEDARKQGELAEGVKKIRLKRQHSFESPLPASPAPAKRNSPPANASHDSPLPPPNKIFAPTSSAMQNSPPRSPTSTTTLSAAGNLFLPSSTYDPSSSAPAPTTNGTAKKASPPPPDVGSPLKKRRSSQHNGGSAMDRVLGMEPRALDAGIWGKEGKEGGLDGIGEEQKGMFGGEDSKRNEMFGGLLGKMRKEDEAKLNGTGRSETEVKEGKTGGTGLGLDVGMEDEL